MVPSSAAFCGESYRCDLFRCAFAHGAQTDSLSYSALRAPGHTGELQPVPLTPALNLFCSPSGAIASISIADRKRTGLGVCPTRWRCRLALDVVAYPCLL